MNKIFVALTGLSLLLTGFAHAEESRLGTFFSAIEGQFDGRGTVQQLNANGSVQVINYTTHIRVDHALNENVWKVSSQLTGDNGAVLQNTANYTVNGELLLIGNATTSEAVQVVEASPVSLTYQFQRVDVVTGRSYLFNYQLGLDPTGSDLTGHTTVTSNGVTVSSETFDVKKW